MLSTYLERDEPGNGGTLALPAEVRAFRPKCANCGIDALLAPGSRPCSFYDCPGLPSQLHVTCPICVYDFFADDGTVKCDHNTCETARRLKANVHTYRAWLRLVEQERCASAGH